MPEPVAGGHTPETAGLCAHCAHVRPVTTDRGSVFLRCAYATIDPRFAKYPRLPVRACAGYAPLVSDASVGQFRAES